MAIDKKLIKYATKARFTADLGNSLIPTTSIVFIQDTGELWTHGIFFGGHFSSVDSNYGTLTLDGSSVNLSLYGHKHNYTDLLGSTTTANQAIVSNGTANGWTLKTLGSGAFDSTSYLPLSGGTLTGVLQLSNSGLKFADNAFGGGDDIAKMYLATKGGEATTMTFEVGNDGDDTINFITPSSTGLTHNSNIILDSLNYSSYALPLSGGTLTGALITNPNVLGWVFRNSPGWYGSISYDSYGGECLGIMFKNPSTKFKVKAGYDSSSFAGNNAYTSMTNADLEVGAGYAKINGNIVWHAGNDGSGSGLDADMLDGYHWQNILERTCSGTSNSGSSVGWFRIGYLNRTDGAGTNTILHIARNFYYANNEAYSFSISQAYSGGINITQLSGYANNRLITKIRLDWTASGTTYIDLYIDASTTENDYVWTTIGNGVSYTSWVTNPTLVGTAYEFTTVNGTKSDRGFTGDIAGNATSATKLYTARSFTIGNTAKSFDGTGNVSWSLSEIGAAAAIHSHTISQITDIGNASVNYAASAGKATLLGNFYSSRPTSADITPTGSGGVISFKATSSMTTSKPVNDSHILHFYWDNTGGWDCQMAISTNNSPTIQTRGQNAGTWGSWKTVLDSTNYSYYALPLHGTADATSWLAYNSDLTYGVNRLQYFNAHGLSTSNLPNANSAPDSDWWYIIRMNHANPGGYYADLAFALNDTQDAPYFRIIQNGRIVRGWSKFITSDNIASQSVSYANSAGNASTLGSLSLGPTANTTANSVVRTDGNGYIQCGYINSTSGGGEKNASSPPYVWGTNGTDNFLRTYETSCLSVAYAANAGAIGGYTTADIMFKAGGTFSGTVYFGTSSYYIHTSGLAMLGDTYCSYLHCSGNMIVNNSITTNGINRNVAVVTTTTTLSPSHHIIYANNAYSEITLYLPSSPTDGQEFIIKGCSGTKNKTIHGNGHNLWWERSDEASVYVQDVRTYTVVYSSILAKWGMTISDK